MTSHGVSVVLLVVHSIFLVVTIGHDTLGIFAVEDSIFFFGHLHGHLFTYLWRANETGVS